MYYQHFIVNFVSIAAPLHQLMKNKPFDKVFSHLKQELGSSAILVHPQFEDEFILDTDASDYVIGGCSYKFKTTKNESSLMESNTNTRVSIFHNQKRASSNS